MKDEPDITLHCRDGAHGAANVAAPSNLGCGDTCSADSGGGSFLIREQVRFGSMLSKKA
jgi:hypothetical protein